LLLQNHKIASYGFEVDIWSVGIVFYIILMGHTPWNLPTNIEDYKIAIEEQWDKVMKEVGPLIKGMLALNKYDRWTTEEVVNYTRNL
jgi:serine/threonine-protein kinase Chk1